MNIEQRRFKKTIKARKRSIRKKRILASERNEKREKISHEKRIWRVERKKIAAKNTANRQERISELRRVLSIPESEIISLEVLEKRFNEMYSKEQKKSLQKAALSGRKSIMTESTKQ